MVKIAAIISISEATEGTSVAAETSHSLGNADCLDARADILGKSLLDRTIETVSRFGVEHHTIIPNADVNQLVSRAGKTMPATTVESWEDAVGSYMQNGIDVLLLVRLNAYTDLDYAEMLKFHLDKRSALTQAYAADGALDVALVQASQLRNVDGAYRKALRPILARQSRFQYRGYVNRLAGTHDLFTLVEDGVRGRCELKPVGTETRSGVWQGSDSEIDESAVVTGPAFIGAGSRIAASCTISAGTVIERECEIDCGTTIQESWIRQNTYVGVALDVRRSIVAGDTLFNVDRNVTLNIGDPHFIGANEKSASLFAGLGSFIWGEHPAA